MYNAFQIWFRRNKIEILNLIISIVIEQEEEEEKFKQDMLYYLFHEYHAQRFSSRWEHQFEYQNEQKTDSLNEFFV